MEETPLSIWTPATLKALMDERDRRYEQRSVDSEKALQAALSAVKEARDENKHQTDKWQASANEWRQAMTDKDRNFVTKSTLWGTVLGIVGLVLALVQILERIGKP